jgi:hypothetical protein
MLAIEGWGNASQIQNGVQKIGENNRKARKFG